MNTVGSIASLFQPLKDEKRGGNRVDAVSKRIEPVLGDKMGLNP
ncbi:MAG: hypothetical protein ABI633_01830 [Burkholderiales bacterium]